MLRLGGAILPDGTVVKIFDKDNDGSDTTLFAAEHMPFAQFSARFVNVDLSGRMLRGANLSGDFVNVRFDKVDLRGARLASIYSRASFNSAKLLQAKMSGEFVRTELQNANFTGADLKNANFVNCNFKGAEVNDEQLRQTLRLRATTLPDGSMYQGQFNLEGDREDARRCDINPDDTAAMREFCQQAKIKFRRR
jgi:hypothetical protein